jgi:hypothetical protein
VYDGYIDHVALENRFDLMEKLLDPMYHAPPDTDIPMLSSVTPREPELG